jgi:hypothetical protein
VTLSFLTPWAALVALVGLAGLAGLASGERRSRAVCRALGLVPRPWLAAAVPGLAVVLVAAFLGLAAAQPVVARVHAGEGRKDAEALVVIDISRSMLARRHANGLSRMDRAKTIAQEVGAALPGVPVGIASLTDRVLPHLFPTTNQDVFASTLDRAVGIERPPPDRTGRGRATALGALALLGTGNFFGPRTTKRVAIVLTDGESLPVRISTLERGLARGGVRLLVVHVWDVDERIFRPGGRPLRQYVADPDSPDFLRSVADAVGGQMFEEEDVAGVVRATRTAIGEGPLGPSGRELQTLELAPYAVLGSFVPLLFLVWRRNLAG